jgi:mono/diheme cytochrome c family protein
MRFSRLLVAALVLAGAAAAFRVFQPRLPAAERGRRLAERTGCFGCHGPEGIRGAANPGRTDKTVPTYEGDVMMYAKSPGEIREWIRDGVTSKRAKSQTWRKERERGALRMPAFKDRLSERQIDELVAYVMAVSGTSEPEDSLAARGRERAGALGCVGCHGAGGRLARPNPRSLKGYVPAWDGADFPELVRGRDEFREWVEDGVSVRFKGNPVARFFLDRAVLKMPAYRHHLAPGDLEALWAYVEWLRRGE